MKRLTKEACVSMLQELAERVAKGELEPVEYEAHVSPYGVQRELRVKFVVPLRVIGQRRGQVWDDTSNPDPESLPDPRVVATQEPEKSTKKRNARQQ